ncbi:phage tail sheath family protein [Flexivirga alba]|uniref:Phage tail sheath family protein n=1 Tax=Flexivirga alba TaxID=702742 RepID=A0ABW2AHC0_9MICO
MPTAMHTGSTPGVYYQAIDAGGPAVTPLRTDIAGFAGIAERGPVDLPVPVTSWRQFVSWFGDVIPAAFLAYAVRGFFENGGVRAWVVRVASNDPVAGAAAASADFGGAAGPVWRLAASTAGAWGNRLTVNLRELNRIQLTTTGTDPDGRWSRLPGLSGLAVNDEVRLTQPGRPPVWRVVAAVDPMTSQAWWVPPEGPRRGYHLPVTGLDHTAPMTVESVEYRVLVSASGVLVGLYDRLSLVPENIGYGPLVLAGVRPPVDPVTGTAVWAPPAPILIEELRADTADLRGLDLDPATETALAGGRSGLSWLSVDDFVGQPVAPDDGPVAAALKRRGLRALEDVAEVALLAAPDALVRPEPPRPAPPPPCVPDPCLDLAAAVITYPAPDVDAPPLFTDQQVYAVQAALVEQCERLRYRFALLDPPYAAATDPAAGLRGVLDWRARFDTRFAALNHPWLRVLDPLDPTGASIRLVPPSGHLAGGYAAGDLQTGVHRAPANRPVQWALAASVAIDETGHGVLNDAGVNAIRTIGNRGLRAMGARTVSSDPDWRFVNVRRLMSMVEKALDIALQWVVFEPNDVFTRARVTLSVTNFLLGLHEQGMFAGSTPAESFYVTCNETNNPEREIDLGRLLVEVGIAPAVPFEFVVVRVGRVRDSLQVKEASAT